MKRSAIKFKTNPTGYTRYVLPIHLNWFQRMMWKWCFGLEVEDYDG